MKLEGPVCCVEMALFCVTRSSQSLLVKDEVEDVSFWKLGGALYSLAMSEVSSGALCYKESLLVYHEELEGVVEGRGEGLTFVLKAEGRTRFLFCKEGGSSTLSS